jgi:hypothetical protein
MKKIILAIMITGLSFAQNNDPYVAFSTSFDVRNAIVGSEPTNNNPELNFILGFQMVGKSVEVGIFYESFKSIEFSRYGLNAGYQFPIIEKLTITPSLQFSIIDRKEVYQKYKGSGSFLSYGGNINIRYEIVENITIGLRSECVARTDLNYLYGGSNYIFSNYLEIGYKINLNN